jgi:hypothetical protein
MDAVGARPSRRVPGPERRAELRLAAGAVRAEARATSANSVAERTNSATCRRRRSAAGVTSYTFRVATGAGVWAAGNFAGAEG